MSKNHMETSEQVVLSFFLFLYMGYCKNVKYVAPLSTIWILFFLLTEALHSVHCSKKNKSLHEIMYSFADGGI